MQVEECETNKKLHRQKEEEHQKNKAPMLELPDEE